MNLIIMIKRTLRLFTFLLTVGILAAGCAATNPNIEKAKSSIKDQNYQAALEAANKAIQQNPQSGLGYFYKGVAYSEIAGSKDDPSARHEYYEKMSSVMDSARTLFNKAEKKPDEANRIDAVMLSTWSKEHNRAVELVTTDSLKSQPNIKKAIEHLKNATVLEPDSTLSYDVMAEVYLMEKPPNLDGAIDALSTSIQKTDSASADKYNRLASFYANAKKYDQEVDLLKEALKLYPDSVKLNQNLADAYLKKGETDKALNLVQKLINKDPNNSQYHLVMGTQLYQSSMSKSDSLNNNYDKLFDLEQQKKNASGQKAQKIDQQISSIEQSNKSLSNEIDKLSSNALTEMKKVVDLKPKDDEAYNIIGVIYQNKAAAIYQERNRTDDMDKQEKLNQQAQDQLKQAMNYYEKAADLAPEKKKYWRNLFKVYTTLGMDQKAKEAMQKAGMDTNSN